MANSDYRWRVCVEEKQGFNPVSIMLFATKDPAEAWAYLLTRIERMNRKRIFYVKEYGRYQRWTDFRKIASHLFKQNRRRYYLDYEDFLRYASGRPRDEYHAPQPDEVDEELLMIPDIAVEGGESAPTSQLLEVKSVWRHTPVTKRRL